MQDPHLNYGDEFLRFGFKPSPKGQVEPVVEILWEPTPEAVVKLAEAKATEAHLLIVVESSGNELNRIMAPLEAGRWFVPLGTPGESHIHACIVWSDDPKDRSAKRMVLAKDNEGEYKLYTLGSYRPAMLAIEQQIEAVEESLNLSDHFDEEHKAALEARLDQLHTERYNAYEQDYETIIRPDLFEYRYSRESRKTYQLGRAKLTVNVPEQMFAKSWRITEKLGNLLMKSARDQCQLRRRAIITAATSPLWLIVMIVFFIAAMLVGAVVVMALTIWGSRNLDFSYFNPRSDADLQTIFAYREPSRWWTRRVETTTSGGWKEVSFRPRQSIFYIINPVTILLGAVVVGIEMFFGVDGWRLAIPFVLVGLILGTIILTGVLMERREQAVVKEAPADLVRQQVLNRYSAVSVKRATQAPTLHLRYLETKARFCKPFARRA